MRYDVKGRTVDKATRRTRHWKIDLNPLANGRRSKTYPFRGRPLLAARLLEAFRLLTCRGERSSAMRFRFNIYVFFHFLDYLEELSRLIGSKVQPVTIEDLSWKELEVLWKRFIDWLRVGNHKPRTRYYVAYDMVRLFSCAFDLEMEGARKEGSQLSIYVYFKDKQSSSYGGEPIKYEEAIKAYRILARLWSDACRRVDKGRALAALGGNPLGGSKHKNDAQRKWDSLNNRLWVVLNLLPFPGLSSPPGDKLLAAEFKDRAVPPDLCLPYADASGLWPHVQAVFFSQREIGIAFSMVCMKTGMNTDSIARQVWTGGFILIPYIRTTKSSLLDRNVTGVMCKKPHPPKSAPPIRIKLSKR